MQIIAYGYLVNDRTRYPLKSLGGQQRTVVTLFLTYSFKDTKHCYPKSRNLMDSCYTGIVCEFQVQVLIPDIFSKINLVYKPKLLGNHFIMFYRDQMLELECQSPLLKSPKIKVSGLWSYHSVPIKMGMDAQTTKRGSQCFR